MKTENEKIGVLLTALVILGMLTMGVSADPVVLGKEVKEGISDKYAKGKSDSPILTYSPVKTGIYAAAAATTKKWSANTDLYNYWYLGDPAPRLNAYSRSRDGSSAWDINTIAVRSRVWKNNGLTLDKTDSSSKSADASVYWKYACPNYYCGGTFKAQGDHTFKMTGYQSWYPVTTDTLS
jgi:hypothetical protein